MVTVPPEILEFPFVTCRLATVPSVTFSVAADVVAPTVPPVMLAVPPVSTSSAARVPVEVIRPPETFDAPVTTPPP